MEGANPFGNCASNRAARGASTFGILVFAALLGIIGATLGASEFSVTKRGSSLLNQKPINSFCGGDEEEAEEEEKALFERGHESVGCRAVGGVWDIFADVFF